jgi:pimeloyl-ACP methyl ester carboxylesterase
MRVALAGTDYADDTLLVTGNDQCEQPKEHYINIENTRVRYVEAGAGPGVVLIHGNAGSVDDFDFQSLGQLCRNHRVIAVDRPGHGKSERPNGSDATLQFQTHLLHETLSHLGVTRPVLVGHSWGGSLALAYAVEYPKELSAIVLLAPAAYADGGPDQFLRAVLKTPVIGDVSLTMGRVILGKHLLKKELRKAFYPDTVPDEYLRHASSSWLGHKQVRAILEDEYGLDKELEKVSKHYSEISIPVVIVTGDRDKVVSAEHNAFRLKTSINQSQLIELKNTGHQVPQTHPESIYNALSLIPNASLQQRGTHAASLAAYMALARPRLFRILSSPPFLHYILHVATRS